MLSTIARWLVIPMLLQVAQSLAEEPTTCGIKEGLAGQFGGTALLGGPWPWQVSLELATENKHFCGGAIISEYWVITAAHCFIPPVPQSLKDIVVVTGMTRQASPEMWVRYFNPHHVILHEAFNEQTGENDIALVRVGERLHFGEHVLPVCFPNNDIFESSWSVCYITGWMKSGEETMDLLLEAPVTLISFRECNNTIFSGKLQPSMMCMDFKKSQDLACHMDSGGPVVCKIRDGQQFYLIGVVSWVSDCSNRWPGVFTMTKSYLKWVEQVTALYGKKFDFKEYGAESIRPQQKAMSHKGQNVIVDQAAASHTYTNVTCVPASMEMRSMATVAPAASGSVFCTSVVGIIMVHLRSLLVTVLAT
ncbi:chymotrypsinogen B-like [Narcine bancroftii]|uniref:chymotrypsinogen B-like n=1 Tax=Narcine bancroftii TaxID=1343680 RepID=UPI003831BC09